ncbi:hypothetical protein CDD80_5456 [Ophiocordyceps camponoti-rufipedis]|uniref:CCHC-type domain-containing protein n=1 Tax=Ophiocordyceps camponoti-rufipedis TaxID=2004952 RepID=A0A2C5ZHH6_9HYPO|nr:hypothetical protein CDD80_5456 [Ophiocordyceps camponoti-rufipedis]
MTDSAHGRLSGQAQEPRCYNCGSHSHWAVACPEATRETPAGLAAWRSASAAGQPHGKNHGYCSVTKRSKGPIITKYSPPSYASPMGSYPPPPPIPPQGVQPPSGLYPAQVYPNSFPPGYPQPFGYNMAVPFGPPTPYMMPHYGQPAHLGLAASPPPPPPGTLAPGCPNPEYRPPYQPYRAPLHPRAASHRPAPPKTSLPYGRQAELASSIAKQPNTRLSHPLPPKPPPSYDQALPQRDYNYRRRNDRQHYQDRGRGGFGTYDSKANNSSAHGSSPADRLPSHNSPSYGRLDEHDADLSSSKDALRPSRSPEKQTLECAVNDVRASAATKSEDRSDVDAVGKCAESNEVASHKDEDSPRPCDDTNERERPLSPRSHETGGSEVESAVVDNAASATLEASDEQEDGEISSNEETLSPIPDDRDVVEKKGNSPAIEESWRRKRRYSDEWDDDESYAKRSRPNGTSHAHERNSEDDLWDSLDVPRQADRKRRGSAASRGSRQSSVSSKSSDLNSLEAELLGRPVKQRRTEGASPPPRTRAERKPVSKPKRRQTNTNSAYSRRCYNLVVKQRTFQHGPDDAHMRREN